MPGFVPFRDLFEQHREEVVGRLDRIDEKLDRIDEKLDDHSHPGLASWVGLVPLLVLIALAIAAS